MISIYHVANTGFLLECNGKKILIDGIHTKKVDPYHSVDEETISKIIHGEPPFDHLDLLLFTHYHWDHLDGETSLTVLKNQPNLKLFSSKQTVDYIKTMTNYDISLNDQLVFGKVNLKSTNDYSLNGINFSVASLLHDGDAFKEVINFSYIIKFDQESIFHCGDAKPNLYNYENLGLDQSNITIALLYFSYIALSSSRKVINSFIKPKKIFIMHLPDGEKDSYNWLKTVHKIVLRYGKSLPEMVLCEKPNTEY